jgi:hypothetical protein
LQRIEQGIIPQVILDEVEVVSNIVQLQGISPRVLPVSSKLLWVATCGRQPALGALGKLAKLPES